MVDKNAKLRDEINSDERSALQDTEKAADGLIDSVRQMLNAQTAKA